MNTLHGMVAVVTGASKGIGAAIAIRLGNEGAQVIVNYATSASDAERAVSEIAAAGGRSIAMQGDFSKPMDIERSFGEIRRRFGRVDILVNNAGVYRTGPIEETTQEIFNWHYDLNVLGLLLSVKEDPHCFPKLGAPLSTLAPSWPRCPVRTAPSIRARKEP